MNPWRQDVQKDYERECKSFQLMCRLFYAAAIDETAYPGLIEKEIEVLTETKRAHEQRGKEAHEWQSNRRKRRKMRKENERSETIC